MNKQYPFALSPIQFTAFNPAESHLTTREDQEVHESMDTEDDKNKETLNTKQLNDSLLNKLLCLVGGRMSC